MARRRRTTRGTMTPMAILALRERPRVVEVFAMMLE